MAVGLPDPKAITVENDIRDKVYKAIFHHVGNVCLWPKFHHYRTHRPTNIFFELLGILPRYLTRNKRSERSLKALEAFNASDDPYFFYPLQLVSDSQVQLYSPYVRVQEAIADVLASFALHAHHKTRLLIKNHPLDNGLIDYGEFIKGSSSKPLFPSRIEQNCSVRFFFTTSNNGVFCHQNSIILLRWRLRSCNRYGRVV